MDHDDRLRLEKLLDLKDSEYYVWVYRGKWLLSFRTLSPNRAASYVTGYARDLPDERVKIMKGSTRVIFDGLARYYNGIIK